MAKLSRREFLAESASMGAAASAGFSLGCSRLSDAQFPMVTENQVSFPKNGKKVLIIGAGLSGLMSACELLDRGFEVTILERDIRPGGKLISWREKNFGESSKDPSWQGHPLEHGTHTVPAFYNNFREFLGRRGLSLREKRSNEPYSVFSLAYSDGLIDDRPIFNLPGPWHTFPLLREIKSLTPVENREFNYWKNLKFFSFDPTNLEEVKELDSISVQDWANRNGMPRGLIEKVIDPVLEMSNFKTSKESSALMLHRYISSMWGSYKDMVGYQFFQDSTSESIIDPLYRYVLSKGAKVYFTSEADEFKISGQKMTGVKTKAIPKGMYICPICGELHSYSPVKCKRCGYQGCEFQSVEAVEKEFEADYFFLGVDPLNAKKILMRPPFSEIQEFKKSEKIPLGAVTIVYMWYPKKPQADWESHFEKREVVFCGGFEFLSTTMNHRILKAGSYSDCGADIIETQIGRGERTAALSDSEIVKIVDRDLRKVIPDLSPVQDFRVIRWDHFSTMTVGSENARPPVVTPVDNFFVLGDYVQLEENAIFMEKVTVAVRVAINRLMELEGKAFGKLRILPRETPNLSVSLLRKFYKF